jgi:hypothetical protein
MSARPRGAGKLLSIGYDPIPSGSSVPWRGQSPSSPDTPVETDAKYAGLSGLSFYPSFRLHVPDDFPFLHLGTKPSDLPR